MVDTLALGASAERRGGSSPLSRTKENGQAQLGLFLWHVNVAWFPTRMTRQRMAWIFVERVGAHMLALNSVISLP